MLTGTITQSGDATGVLATSVGELQDKEDALNSTIEDNTQLQKDADESIQSVTDSAKELFDVKVDGTESTEDNTKAQEENADAINATGIAAAGAGTAWKVQQNYGTLPGSCRRCQDCHASDPG